MGIGKVLKDICKEKNTNVNQISKDTGIPASTIYSIIQRDNDKVNYDTLKSICDYLGADINRFYSEFESEQTCTCDIAELYNKLDAVDRADVKGYINGLLRADKYNKSNNQSNAC